MREWDKEIVEKEWIEAKREWEEIKEKSDDERRTHFQERIKDNGKNGEKEREKAVRVIKRRKKER